ncbi:MAG: S8 family serine peptidase [Candidatus Bipolaricaulota bacterium]|nr:S8 family serine peptidase [Candidatus Bipolaricaulota bacterium]
MIGLALLGALAVAFPAQPQSAARVLAIEIPSLAPFSVSFEVEASAATASPDVRGTVTLSDPSGREVDQFLIDPFLVPAGGRVHVDAASRWEFQLAGMYLVRIALDMGAGSIVSASLRFQILPVKLPLAPETTLSAADVYSVYQQPSNWGLESINAPNAWTLSHGDPSVVVAVIDSGIDVSIPQLVASLWTNADEVPDNGIDDDRNGYVDDIHGWDFRDDDSGSLVGSPIHRHGTFVASIIAAQPGRYPIVGVAPGARLMDVRFLDSQNQFGSADWSLFERAVNYAVDNGADIINLSIFANGRPPSSFERALDRARSRGIAIVGISGNLGKSEVMYPGRYDSVLAVSAITPSGLLAAFSNRGPEVAFCAPGADITSFAPGGRPFTDSGTSFAAPHVTGVLALLLSVNPTLTADEAFRILADTAVDLGSRGRDNLYGYGLIDAWAALVAASGR